MDSNLPPAPLSGDLRQAPLAQLLWDLSQSRFTGSLVVLARASIDALCGETTLAFEEGQLAQARLPQPLDTLGEVLCDLGVITEGQRRESGAQATLGEALQGAALVSIGACDAPAVERGLREQLRRKAGRLFAAIEGPWETHAGVDLLEGFGGRRFPIDVEPLLWPSLRAQAEHPVVGAVIERLGTRRLRILAGSAAPSLFADDVATRGAVDGLLRGSRVSELLSAGHPLSMVRPLVALLAMTRQLERVRSSQLPGSSLAPAPVSAAPLPIGDGASLFPEATQSLPPRPAMSLPPLPLLPGLQTRESISAPPRVDPNIVRDKRLRDGELALSQRRPADAEREARAVLGDTPNDIGALLLLARALLAHDAPDLLPEVRLAVTAALSRDPRNDAAFVVTGKMLLREGDAKRALGCYVKAYRLNPRNVEAARAIRLATARRRAGASTDVALANLFLSSG
jgi:hypothetical protein